MAISNKGSKQMVEVLVNTKTLHRAGSTVKSAYQQSVDRVRKRYNVSYQTIGDLCCRRQGLKSIDMFIDMLKEWLIDGNPERLKQLILKNLNTECHPEIDQFFSNEIQGIETTPSVEKESVLEEYESFSVRLHKGHAKKLKVLTVMNELSINEKLSSYLESKIEDEYISWLKSQI